MSIFTERTSVKITVRHEPKEEQRPECLLYRLRCSADQRKPGLAEVQFLTVEDYASLGRLSSYQAFTAAGLKSGQIVAEINEFYPNGRHPAPHEMRRGAGTSLMRRILADAAERGASAVRFYTNSPSMRSFIESRFDYVSINPDKRTLYFKMLGEGVISDNALSENNLPRGFRRSA